MAYLLTPSGNHLSVVRSLQQNNLLWSCYLGQNRRSRNTKVQRTYLSILCTHTLKPFSRWFIPCIRHENTNSGEAILQALCDVPSPANPPLGCVYTALTFKVAMTGRFASECILNVSKFQISTSIFGFQTNCILLQDWLIKTHRFRYDEPADRSLISHIAIMTLLRLPRTIFRQKEAA